MIKKFETYDAFDDIKLNIGDKVMINYKNSKYSMLTGKILSIRKSGPTRGDCIIVLDFNNDMVEFYHIFLMKIEELIEIPSGEVINVSVEDLDELMMTGLIGFNKNEKYYYFKEEDRWQIERFML
jgi:hypothetical protein